MDRDAYAKLADLHKKSNYAGAATLIRMARQEGLAGKGRALTDNQIRDYVKKQATSELFAARPPH